MNFITLDWNCSYAHRTSFSTDLTRSIYDATLKLGPEAFPVPKYKYFRGSQRNCLERTHQANIKFLRSQDSDLFG